MSKVYTGSEALHHAIGLVKCEETKILCDIMVDHSRVTIYKFLSDYYMANIHDMEPSLSIFEKISKAEADNVIYNLKGLSRIGTYFEFGEF